MTPSFRGSFGARLGVVVALVAAVAVAGVPGMQPARGYPGSHVELTGHGWGHGRGMGQYGAQGYATLHGWSYTQILDHFYGGTTMGSLGAEHGTISVHVTGRDGQDAILQGAATTNAAAGTFNALLVRRVGANTFDVYRSNGCGGEGGWVLVRDDFNGTVTVSPAGGTLNVCDGAAKPYQGSFHVIDGNGAGRLINFVATETYVKGVVTKEMGGSFHLQALKAQAVAARSYAWAGARDPYAQQCDSISCQVYSGGASFAPVVEQAVNETAGQVRRFTSTNNIATTEYSSSTGGHTVQDKFPAVPDAGDVVSPRHRWKASVPVSAIEAAWPEIGSLLAVNITKRNGLGEWGGRVLELQLRGTNATRALSGEEFRRKFERSHGVYSSWFNLCDPSGGVDGYWVAAPDGGVFAFGKAQFFGSMGGRPLNRPIVGMGAVPDSQGYWLVASDGGIFAFGSARFHGSTGAMRLNRPVVGMAPTEDGGGYWLVASDGGIFAFGNARFHGSMGATRLNQPVVGMAATPTGGGYWLVAADGGIFAFGDARFHGSMGATRLNQPVTGMAATSDGGGYWMVARDGGIFALGNARFQGSLPGLRAPGPAEAIRGTPTDQGYAVVTSDGRVFSFGDAPYCGDVAGAVPGYRGGVEGIELRRAG